MRHHSDFDLQSWRERCSHILEEVRQSEAFALIEADAPWSAASLDATEGRMLSAWPSFDALPAELKTQYEAFLGEGLRRSFGGSWTELDPQILGDGFEDAPFGLGIAYPRSGTVDVVSSLVPQAYRVGAGTWWSSSFRAVAELGATAPDR